MDLRHDWRVLNEVLFPKASSVESFEAARSALVLVEEEGKVLGGVVSTGEVFAEDGLTGFIEKKKTLDELSVQYRVKETIVVSKKDLERCILEASQLGSNYFQQLEVFRSLLDGDAKPPSNSFFKFKNFGSKQKPEVISSKHHFVVELFSGSLQKMLPRKFNVLVFIDQRATLSAAGSPDYKAVLLSYLKGELDQFFEPDFSSLHENRLVEWNKDADVVGQYLENRYMLPCYAIFATREVWERAVSLSQTQREGAENPKKGDKSSINPWSVLIEAQSEGKSAFYPRNVFIRTLLATSKILGYLKSSF